MIRTTKYFDALSTQPTVPPIILRKPVRIVKAVQRSAQSPSINDLKTSVSTKMNCENDLKPLPLPYSNELILNNQHHRSSDYIKDLFPIPNHLKRKRSIQNSETNSMNNIQTMLNNNIRQTEDLLLNVKKTLETLQANQSIINDEIEINTTLGIKLINIIESKAELNETEKVKLHISEIDTITSILLKLMTRCRCIANDSTCWSSPSAWRTFNASISGRLVLPHSSATPCAENEFNESLCNETIRYWSDSSGRSDQVGTMQYFHWENVSCSINNRNSKCTQGSIPVYAVDAIWPENIQATL
ncbi:unnamed protein product [Rotaria sp. Silwood2]|nr:unnamed protein product [Rotaria sp. Silwood2]